MKPLSRITIFDLKRRLRRLKTFNGYVYQYFTNIGLGYFHELCETDKAVEARTEINRMLDEIVGIVRGTGISAGFEYRDPPALGGRITQLDLLWNIFDLYQYDIPANRVHDIIDRADGVYQNNAGKASWRTINPFYWLWELVIIIADIPIRLLVHMRVINAVTATSNPVILFISGLFRLGISILGIMVSLKVLGYLDTVLAFLKTHLKL
jgi:hypothetical protein